MISFPSGSIRLKVTDAKGKKNTKRVIKCASLRRNPNLPPFVEIILKSSYMSSSHAISQVVLKQKTFKDKKTSYDGISKYVCFAFTYRVL